MARHALVIVNPYAGKRRSQKNLFEIVDRLCQQDYTVSVQTTAKPQDGTEFVKKYGPDQSLIVCCGGDGTLNEIVKGVVEAGLQVPVGYVPAGTTNDFARTLGLPKRVEKCMDRIVTSFPRPCDIGHFNGRPFTYIASLGAFTRVSYSTPQKLKNRLGHTAYLLEGVKEIGHISPFKAALELDGTKIQGEFVFGSVSNSTSIAGLFRLKELDVRLDDGEFELMLVRMPKNILDLNGVIQGLTRCKYDPRHVIFTHGKHLKIQTSRPMAWTLDGEPGGEQTEVEITVQHNAVQLVY